jgi:hypothetical protein
MVQMEGMYGILVSFPLQSISNKGYWDDDDDNDDDDDGNDDDDDGNDDDDDDGNSGDFSNRLI